MDKDRKLEIIAKFEEDAGKTVDWQKLIEGGIFEFFQRIMLTDLKPEIFHEIMSKKSAELNKWVIENLSADIAPPTCSPISTAESA